VTQSGTSGLFWGLVNCGWIAVCPHLRETLLWRGRLRALDSIIPTRTANGKVPGGRLIPKKGPSVVRERKV